MRCSTAAPERETSSGQYIKQLSVAVRESHQKVVDAVAIAIADELEIHRSARCRRSRQDGEVHHGANDLIIDHYANYPGSIETRCFNTSCSATIRDILTAINGGNLRMANIRMEGSIGVRHTDLEQFDNLSVIGNLMYEFTPGMGLNFGMEAGSDISHYLLGLRFSF